MTTISTYKIISAIGLLALLPIAIFAQNRQRVLTFGTFMEKVDSGNLEYAAQKLNLDIAKAGIIAAKVRNNPEIGFSYFNNEQSKKQMGYGGSISLSQTLTFGKRSAAIDLARSNNELTAALLSDYLRNLHADAAVSYYEALKQKELYLVKLDAYQRINELAQSDSIRAAKGIITGIDAIQSKVEAGLAHNELIQAKSEMNRALNELTLYMGKDMRILPLKLEGDLKLAYRDFQLSELIEVGKMQRADLMAALQNIDVAKKEVKVAQRENNSDITVSLEAGHNYEVKNEIAPAPAFNSISAGISLPLPFSKLNKGNLNAARQRLHQASLMYDQATLQVQNEILNAYDQYETANRQVHSFEKNLLTQSSEVLKGKTYSYNRGETSLLEVLNARRTYDEVQSQYYETLFNFGSALIELERSAGIWDLK